MCTAAILLLTLEERHLTRRQVSRSGDLMLVATTDAGLVSYA